jgi:hypothetical protein
MICVEMVHLRLVRIRNYIHSLSSQALPDRIAVFQSNGTLYKMCQRNTTLRE